MFTWKSSLCEYEHLFVKSHPFDIDFQMDVLTSVEVINSIRQPDLSNLQSWTVKERTTLQIELR